LELGQLLVENLTSEEFDISQYSDSYAKELEKLIDAKSKGKIFTIEEKQHVAPTKDLVSALKASLEQKKSPKGRIK
jgi:non-homologous end joining protein Ku